MPAIESPLSFDLKLAVEKENENPVYYVQYGHARIASVLRRALAEDVQERVAPRSRRSFIHRNWRSHDGWPSFRTSWTASSSTSRRIVWRATRVTSRQTFISSTPSARFSTDETRAEARAIGALPGGKKRIGAHAGACRRWRAGLNVASVALADRVAGSALAARTLRCRSGVAIRPALRVRRPSARRADPWHRDSIYARLHSRAVSGLHAGWRSACIARCIPRSRRRERAANRRADPVLAHRGCWPLRGRNSCGRCSTATRSRTTCPTPHRGCKRIRCGRPRPGTGGIRRHPNSSQPASTRRAAHSRCPGAVFARVALLGFRIRDWSRLQFGLPPLVADALAAATITAYPLAVQAGTLQNDAWLAAFWLESLWLIGRRECRGDARDRRNRAYQTARLDLRRPCADRRTRAGQSLARGGRRDCGLADSRRVWVEARHRCAGDHGVWKYVCLEHHRARIPGPRSARARRACYVSVCVARALRGASRPHDRAPFPLGLGVLCRRAHFSRPAVRICERRCPARDRCFITLRRAGHRRRSAIDGASLVERRAWRRRSWGSPRFLEPPTCMQSFGTTRRRAPLLRSLSLQSPR